MNINLKQIVLLILGVVILAFLAHIFVYFLLFALIIWFIYIIYKAIKPYVKTRSKKDKNGKVIIEAKYEEK